VESGRGSMKMRMISILIVALGIFCASTTEGQALREVFSESIRQSSLSIPYKALSRLRINV
jgi:hypothetical protein